MRRLIGGCLLLAGGGLLAWRQIAAEKRELAVLGTLAGSLRQMAEEIRMTRSPFPRILEKLSRQQTGPTGVFFSGVAQAAERGELVSEAWQKGTGTLPLDSVEQMWMLEASRALAGDEEQVCRGLLWTAERMERRLDQRRSGSGEWERRVVAMSLSGAALLAILLI